MMVVVVVGVPSQTGQTGGGGGGDSDKEQQDVRQGAGSKTQADAGRTSSVRSRCSNGTRLSVCADGGGGCDAGVEDTEATQKVQ